MKYYNIYYIFIAFLVFLILFLYPHFALAQYDVRIFSVTPQNPAPGETVQIEIVGYSGEGAPMNNVVMVSFGDNTEATIPCQPTFVPPIGGLPPSDYECEGILEHVYTNPGNYPIRARICVWPPMSPDWQCKEDIFVITVGGPPPGACSPDGCNGNCPPGCDLTQDPDCGCADNNGCCAPGCDQSNDNDCPAQPSPPSGYDNPLIWQNILQLLLYALRFIFNALLGISILMVVLSGLFLATSGHDPTRQQKGKRTLMYALIGFSIAFLANGLFLLFRIIFGVRLQ